MEDLSSRHVEFTVIFVLSHFRQRNVLALNVLTRLFLFLLQVNSAQPRIMKCRVLRL